jgi:mRNA-degrading endonuclease RelE of RelBE toxin-antitoxin system
MNLKETSTFQKLRKKIKETTEKESLKQAIVFVLSNPEAGKKLKGEFKNLRAYRYSVKGQPRRLIYKIDEEDLILFSFGPREGIYNK